MQDGCKVYVDSYVALNGSCFHGRLDYLQQSSLGGRYGIRLRARSHMTSRYIILEVSWDGLWTFLLGSHNFMVIALDSGVKSLST